MKTKSKELTIEAGKYGGYTVYAWGVYERSSVLAGQTKKQFIDNFNELEEAQAAYPEATYDGCIRSAHNTFDHLPDPDEPSSWRINEWGDFDDGRY